MCGREGVWQCTGVALHRGCYFNARTSGRFLLLTGTMLFARASVPLLLLLLLAAFASARPRLLEHFSEEQHLESHKHRCHYEVAPGSVLHDFGEVSVVEEPDGQRYELPECIATRKYKEQERALAAEFGRDDESVARREISAADGANPNNQWAAWY